MERVKVDGEATMQRSSPYLDKQVRAFVNAIHDQNLVLDIVPTYASRRMRQL